MTLEPGAFALICKLVYEQTAIVLEAGKEYLVESRLAPLVRARACRDVNELCLQLARPDEALLAELVEAMTTNETSFFRDRLPFDALEQTVLPELVARRAQSRTLRIWCAACSTGQEPYSVAMLLEDCFPELASWNVIIRATDVSKPVLARAQQGVYRQDEVNRGLGTQALTRHFVRRGDDWSIKPTLRSAVRFEHLNLNGTWPHAPRFDLILLRNVLIYFDQTTRLAVLRKVRRQLADDGYLVLGGSETLPHEMRALEKVPIVRAGVYRAVKQRPSTSSHAR
ncbi:MAG: cheR2 2 [Myxococcaceae bacterium]|nr:cheR2 2 [Myxococcaceae bacterium]